MRFNGWVILLAVAGVILALPVILFAIAIVAEFALMVAPFYIAYLAAKKWLWPWWKRRQAAQQLARMRIQHPEHFMTDRQVLEMVRRQIVK